MKRFSHLKSLFALVVFMLSVVNVSGETKTLSVDFDSSLSAYESVWKFDNIKWCNNGEGVANSSCAAVTGITASITTVNPIYSPEQISFYLSTNIIDAEDVVCNWTIQVSADGNQWVNIGESVAANEHVNEWHSDAYVYDLTNYKNKRVYVRLSYSGVYSERYIDNIILNYNDVPMHEARFYSNGSVFASKDYYEGESITLPASVTTPSGFKFMGWVSSMISGTTDVAPEFVESPVMGLADVSYHAVFAKISVQSTADKKDLVLNDKDSNLKGDATGKNRNDEVSYNGWVIRADYVSGCAKLLKDSRTYIKVPENNHLIIKAISINYKESNMSPVFNFSSSSSLGSSFVFSANGGTKSVSFDFGGRTYETGYIWASEDVIINNIVVEYGSPASYSDYCTKLPSVTLTIGKTGYSTLFYGDRSLVVPEGVTASTYKLDNDSKLQVSIVHEAGGVIPAGEAVVIHCPAAYSIGDKELEFKLGSASASDADADNILKGTDVATSLDADPSCYFYGLSTNADWEFDSVGFYWMNDNGTAFMNGANKAYLKVKKSVNVKAFVFSDMTEEETSVSDITNVKDDVVYNLAGQRVNKVQKGIYIKNGKKHISK